MADAVLAKGSESNYEPHPVMQSIPALCVDVINLGEKLETYPGSDPMIIEKCAILFRTGAKNSKTGELIDISQEFTVSLGEKANLRKFMQQWRGRNYTPEQIKAGVEIHKMVGNWALLTTDIKTSKSNSDRQYAVIVSAVGVPEVMKSVLPTFPPYERSKFWQERKDEYAKEVKEYRKAHLLPDPTEPEYPEPLKDEEDDLPF